MLPQFLKCSFRVSRLLSLLELTPKGVLVLTLVLLFHGVGFLEIFHDLWLDVIFLSVRPYLPVYRYGLFIVACLTMGE